jgi:copper chaperone CopZ
MTCGHCVAAITGSVVKLSGVTQADVNLGNATLTVLGDHVNDDAVAAAVEEAGYTVVR